MKFSLSTLIIATLAAGAAADLHNYCICANKSGGQLEYNDSATRQMCVAYLKRNTGNKWWDSCPDCTYLSTDLLCRSKGKHMGGDQVRAYCAQFGASESRC
ncbi:hypothetical protein ACEPPN_007551 [Leptodophora sp. 'Broadleaf-Isolate-01']